MAKDKKTWQDAQDSCQRMNKDANLLSVSNIYEQGMEYIAINQEDLLLQFSSSRNSLHTFLTRTNFLCSVFSQGALYK